MKKLTEADVGAIREACQKSIDLDKQVTASARPHGISEEEAREIIQTRPKAVAPPSSKRPGQPKGTGIGATAKAPRPQKQKGGQHEQVVNGISGLSGAVEVAAAYLPMSEGERAVLRSYFDRLKCFESGVAFAEGSHAKEVPNGAN